MMWLALCLAAVYAFALFIGFAFIIIFVTPFWIYVLNFRSRDHLTCNNFFKFWIHICTFRRPLL